MAKPLELPINPKIKPLAALKLIADGNHHGVLFSCPGYDACDCASHVALLVLYLLGYETRGNVAGSANQLRSNAKTIEALCSVEPPKVRK